MTFFDDRVVLHDHELVRLVADEPELLAIVDAYAATQHAAWRRRRARATVVRRALPAIAAFAVVLVALLQPWQAGGPSFTSRALAAVGAAPVLHAVVETQSSQASVVDLSTGRSRPATTQEEVWYDAARDVSHVVVRRDGRELSDVLDLGSKGIVTANGRGYTCAWIASHPIQAARARVSCEAGASTTPRHAAVDPALAAFVRGYRVALANGSARRLGDATIGGRAVAWLRIGSESGGTAERVAVDAVTYVPVAVQPLDVNGEPSGTQWRVTTIESLGAGQGDFELRPQQSGQTPSTGEVTASNPIDTNQIASALGRPALWLGTSFAGLALSRADRETLTSSYTPGSTIPPEVGVGIRLDYGEPTQRGAGRYLKVQESPQPQMAYGFPEGRTFYQLPAPPDGQLALVDLGPFSIGQLQRDGMYITLTGLPDLVLKAAHSLQLATPPR